MRGTSTLRPSGRFLLLSGLRPPLVALAVIALLVSCATPAPTPPLPSPTPVGSTTASNLAPTTTPPAAAAWTRLDLPALAQGARLEPTKAGAGGLAVDTAFRLTSLDGRSPEVLAAALVTSPAVALDVASVDGTTAIVRPRAPLRPDTTYRIALGRPDGSTEATWAAVIAGPLAVNESVPGNQATRVPRNTGIEVTFNQYGVSTADVKAHFTISPPVSGTFRAAGRTVAFAPATPLKAATLYTVTLRHGLPLAGTGQVLGQDVIIRFETRKSGGERVTVGFRHPLADANPHEQPAITLDVSREEDGRAPGTIPVTVHRLGGLDAAIAAWRAIRDYPRWTIASDATAVQLAALPRAWKGTARVRVEAGDTYWIRLPRLATGWYVVTETWGGVPRQVVLQVSDVSAFALAASDRTVVWVNDIATGRAIEGATVALDGVRVGRTDGRGLLTYDTPTPAGAEGAARDLLLVIRDGGRAAVLPLQADRGCDQCGMGTGNAAWWRAIGTDRVTYRSSDTINAWGMARNRETGKVPGSVRLELLTSSSDDAGPSIATATAAPDGAGAFTAALRFRDLPTGSYRLRFLADGRDLGETWLEVATIVKPAYRLELSTDRHAIIAGQSVRTTVRASFFEGTHVAGTALTVGLADQRGTAVTTDTTGTAIATVTMRATDEPTEQWTVDTVAARPTLPEEADIRTGSDVVVFRSSAVVDVQAAVAGTRLTVTGAVSDVALERYEGALSDPWAIDPRGDPRPNAKVRLTIVEKTNVRRQTGTRYDFIRKIVVPAYDDTERSATLPARTVTTRADGTFRLALTVRGGSNRWYEVRATYTDEAGRSTASSGAGQAATMSGDLDGVRLERADGKVAIDEELYSIGEAVRVRLVGGSGATASSRYLFAVHARGLAYVTTGTSSTFRTRFDEDWLAGAAITGVRFNGNGYEAAVAGYHVAFRRSDRGLKVSVTPDTASYTPGATVSLSIRVTNGAGKPVASTVMVRVVDEKLFATGAASEADVLAMLYEQVDTGIRTWGSTHRTPWDDIGWGWGDTGGGDGGGGDVRSDFRDWLLSTTVTTGADGTGTVRVPLSEDLTSWHVSAAAFTKGLEGGQASVLVPVALPFFVEATVAREYLSVDRPAIRVRGFGTGLSPADTVTFTISSDTLPLATVTRTAKAYAVAEIPLPPLAVGTHRLRIEGTVGSGASRRSDALVRTFDVVASRTTQQATTWTILDGTLAVEAGSSLTTLVLADAGRGRVIPTLEGLRRPSGNRADERLAAALADRTLHDAFGIDEEGDGSDLPIRPYLDNAEGMAILPYASGSLDITALAAMSGDSRIGAQRLRQYLQQVVGDPKEWPRDRRLLALAGLAALGDPVLPDVRAAAAQGDLTVPEQISLALAAVYAGDEPLARTLERAVLTGHGQRRGPWVRIDPGRGFDQSLQTARLAIVAASLGDPIAADLDAWLVENPSRLTSTDLERALAAANWARRVPAADASATLTVGAVRELVTLHGGETRRIELTPAQAAGAWVEPSSGTVLVVQTVDRPSTGGSLTAPAKMAMERLVTPSGTIGSADTVVVRLRVTLGPDAGDECWRVTDFAPSGLAPIQPGSMYDEETGEYRWSTASPDLVDGQRVEFCVSRNPRRPVQELRYVARVVNAGTYAWEPAIIQSTAAPGEGVVVPASTVTIAGIGS